MSYRLIKLEAWIPLILCIIISLFTWSIWSTCRLIQLRRRFKIIINEHEQLKKSSYSNIKFFSNNWFLEYFS